MLPGYNQLLSALATGRAVVTQLPRLFKMGLFDSKPWKMRNLCAFLLVAALIASTASGKKHVRPNIRFRPETRPFYFPKGDHDEKDDDKKHDKDDDDKDKKHDKYDHHSKDDDDCKQACPAGPQGVPGPQGEVGPQGPPGTAGSVGPKGEQGAVGPQGPQGAAGAQGVAGPQGIPGTAGAAGPMGEQGAVGQTGTQGPPGKPGDRGEQGIPGAKGIPGIKGERGETGPAGAAPALTEVSSQSLVTSTSNESSAECPEGETVESVSCMPLESYARAIGSELDASSGHCKFEVTNAPMEGAWVKTEVRCSKRALTMGTDESFPCRLPKLGDVPLKSEYVATEGSDHVWVTKCEGSDTLVGGIETTGTNFPVDKMDYIDACIRPGLVCAGCTNPDDLISNEEFKTSMVLFQSSCCDAAGCEASPLDSEDSTPFPAIFCRC